jgi:carboxymethylenebutenolidase
MNRLLSLTLALLLPFGVGLSLYILRPPAFAPETDASENAACCTIGEAASSEAASVAGSEERFAALANDEAFRNRHDEPAPLMFQARGKTIRLQSFDGSKEDCLGYELSPSAPTKNAVFVIHEWWGLNDYIKRETERLFDDLNKDRAVRVIALDLYDGKVATTREDAGKYMQTHSAERGKIIIETFRRHVGAEARIATIGWCFGGGWSHRAALHCGAQTVGCVIYYGMPETDAAKLAGMNAPTLGIFAKQDRWITPEIAAKFETAVKAAGKPIEIKLYDADHAFANPSSPKHDKDMAQDAYNAVLGFLRRCFA